MRLPTRATAPRGVGRLKPLSGARRPNWLIGLGAIFLVSTYLGAIRISDFPLAENPQNVAGVLLAAAFALTRFWRARLWAGPAKYFLVFFAVTAVLALGRYAVDGDGSGLRTYAQYLQAFLLYPIYFDLCQDRRTARVLGFTFLGATISLSLVANLGIGGAVGIAAAGRGGVERVGVLGMNLNYQAFLYAVAIIALLCRGIACWPRFGGVDWVLAAGGASMLLALVQTGSRGGLLTLTAGVAAALLIMFRGRRWAAYALLVPLVLYGMGHAIMSSELIRARVEVTLYGGDMGARDVLAREAWEMLKERPLVGWGTKYVQELGARLGREHIATHNTYLQIASTFGLAGLVLWLWGLVSTALRLWRYHSDFWGATLLSVLAALTVAMVPGHYGYDPNVWILLALAGAMPFGPPPAKRLRPVATATAGTAARRRLPGRATPQRSGAGVAG